MNNKSTSFDFNKKVFSLISEEFSYINDTFKDIFNDCNIIFSNASLEEIVFSGYPFFLSFSYMPERYDYANFMLLKGVYLRTTPEYKTGFNIQDIAEFLNKDAAHVLHDLKTSCSPLEFNAHIIRKYLLEIMKEHATFWEEDIIKHLEQNRFRW